MDQHQMAGKGAYVPTGQRGRRVKSSVGQPREPLAHRPRLLEQRGRLDPSRSEPRTEASGRCTYRRSWPH